LLCRFSYNNCTRLFIMKKISNITQYLLISLVAILILSGISLLVKDKDIHPKSTWSFLPWAGEWIDVNFLTFSPQAKQAKHLQLASKRLDEYFTFDLSTQDCAYQNKRYVGSLARAYVMANELALIDPALREHLVQVYIFTFNHLGRLDNLDDANTALFVGSARIYNDRAIKTLLQKHQYSRDDTQMYKELIELLRDRVEGRRAELSTGEVEKLNLANQTLEAGIELEWAYDLLIDI